MAEPENTIQQLIPAQSGWEILCISNMDYGLEDPNPESIARFPVIAWRPKREYLMPVSLTYLALMDEHDYRCVQLNGTGPVYGEHATFSSLEAWWHDVMRQQYAALWAKLESLDREKFKSVLTAHNHNNPHSIPLDQNYDILLACQEAGFSVW